MLSSSLSTGTGLAGLNFGGPSNCQLFIPTLSLRVLALVAVFVQLSKLWKNKLNHELMKPPIIIARAPRVIIIGDQRKCLVEKLALQWKLGFCDFGAVRESGICHPAPNMAAKEQAEFPLEFKVPSEAISPPPEPNEVFNPAQASPPVPPEPLSPADDFPILDNYLRLQNALRQAVLPKLQQLYIDTYNRRHPQRKGWDEQLTIIRPQGFLPAHPVSDVKDQNSTVFRYCEEFTANPRLFQFPRNRELFLSQKIRKSDFTFLFSLLLSSTVSEKLQVCPIISPLSFLFLQPSSVSALGTLRTIRNEVMHNGHTIEHDDYVKFQQDLQGPVTLLFGAAGVEQLNTAFSGRVLVSWRG